MPSIIIGTLKKIGKGQKMVTGGKKFKNSQQTGKY